MLFMIEVFASSCLSMDAVKGSIAKKLLFEFKTYANKEPTYYNLVIASDKAIGILGCYKNYLDSKDIAWVFKKYSQIKKSLDFSTIYFGYSKSGFHFIALAQPQMNHNFDYTDSMNKISGFETETSFLADILYLPESYYALDVYVEDLLGKRKVIKIGISIEEEGETQIPIVDLKDSDLNALLSKYNRELIYSDSINSRKWKLYLFRKSVGFPTITVTHEGEEIVLSN